MAEDSAEIEAESSHTTDSRFTLARTPVRLDMLKHYLEKYHDKKSAAEISHGFEFGFPLHYTGPHLPRDSKNLRSVDDHPEIVRQKIQTELENCRIAGPFNKRPISTLRTSPIGLVEKKTPGEYRLIHHLSSPEGQSCNDFIDPNICSVKYTSFDEAVHMIQDMGQGCLLGKLDIKSAFRLLPVSPSDFDQLGFVFDDKFYYDKAMPFGCRISCASWEKVSTFLEFTAKQQSPDGVGDLKHYVDDFLFAGEAGTDNCSVIMKTFIFCADQMGFPIASEKTVWPTTCIVYLGLELDSVDMVVRMPQQKIDDLIAKIQAVKDAKRTTLKVMQQLIGSLNFATRVIVPGRPFLRRLINSTKGITNPHHHLRVNKGMRKDLDMWLEFFKHFNGISVFHDRFWVNNQDVELFTDSAAGPGMGFGAVFGHKWTYGIWPQLWHDKGITEDITVLELFPILVSLVLWGHQLQNKKILFHCDNQSVVCILNSLTSKSDNVMVLVRLITIQCLELNMVIKGSHIPGAKNVLSDCLSRSFFQKFRQLSPNSAARPDMVPNRLWRVFD